MIDVLMMRMNLSVEMLLQWIDSVFTMEISEVNEMRVEYQATPTLKS